jgi:hypothetical protein
MRDHLVMAGLTIAARVLDELRRAHRPLDDDELASRSAMLVMPCHRSQAVVVTEGVQMGRR